MERILLVSKRMFDSIFTDFAINVSPINIIINRIISEPYLLIGSVCLIIGFSIGILKRIIHS